MTAERMLIRAANTLPRFLSALLLTVGWNSAFASTVVEIGKVLPPISITQGGQVVIEKDGYRIAPWSGPRNLGQIQVIQYVPGTRIVLLPSSIWRLQRCLQNPSFAPP
jgi:hypothetical protein